MIDIRRALVVNLIAGSGAGKTTNSKRLFAMLKDVGIEVEEASEYVKDMIYEGRTKIFECQPYIFGKQLYKLHRLADEVDIILTDRPILLDAVYDPEQDEDFRKYILKKFNQFDNLNVYLNRTKPFNPNGRNEKSIEEAIRYDNLIKDFLDNNNIDYITVNGNQDGCYKIISEILDRLHHKKGK